MKTIWITFVLLFGSLSLMAQYAPGIGKSGTSAMHKDSSAFVAWASSAEVLQGPVQIGQDSLGNASVGHAEMATGKAGINGVVSLGDGGMAVLQFAAPIRNESSWDFAVFENSFDGHFLELAFVEVSSDGERYVRFPSASLTDTMKIFTGFDTLYPEHLNNLAGKYPAMYGTPFDLEELKDSVGLNVNKITHVRIVDVIGTANSAYCSRDASGRIIRDPWPTPFPSGGFDLDAVGVIHQEKASAIVPMQAGSLHVWPQPARNELWFELPQNASGTLRIYSISGTLFMKLPVQARKGEHQMISNLNLSAGIYLLELALENGKSCRNKFLVSP
jgi:hypothetical protein